MRKMSKMSRKLIAEFREKYPEFDGVLKFVKEHGLPVPKCNYAVRAWPRVGGKSVPWGHSNAAESVANSICQARKAYEEVEGHLPGKVEELSVRKKGSTVFVHADGHKLVSFSRLTTAETNRVYATNYLRHRYGTFDEALEFVARHKFPKCKCAVWADPFGRGAGSYGYSASWIHVAAAICLALEEGAQEVQWPVEDLRVRSSGRKVFVFIEDYDLIWFERLTPPAQKKAKAEWLKQTMALEEKKPRNKRLSAVELKKRDPWKSDLILFPYMPGGAFA